MNETLRQAQPALHEVEPSFHDGPDGLIIRSDQIITDDFLKDIAEKRNTTERTGWLHEVAELPTGVVEVWKAQGFDINDRNIKARDIVKRLRTEGLETSSPLPKGSSP
jgi:hypothetical protein